MTSHATDVSKIFDRVAAEYATQEQMDEFTGHLFAELQDLPNDQFAEAIANLGTRKDWSGGNAAAQLAGLWAERDLPAARAWLLGLKGDRLEIHRAVFETWARMDAPGMVGWMKTHAGEVESETFRRTARFAISKAVANTDPDQCFRAIDAMREPGGASSHHSRLYENWAKRDPAAAMKRALEEPDEKERTEAIMAGATEWAGGDPAAACAWAEKLPDPIVSGKALVSIGYRIGQKDPAAAVDFLVKLPQTQYAQSALQQSIAQWAYRDLPQALGWAVTQDDKVLGPGVFAKLTAGHSDDQIQQAIASLPAAQRPQAEERWRANQQATGTGSK